jgi:AcrR family transcriptional regulator
MKIKDEEKYERILQATSDIIVRDGAVAVSTTKVAKLAGVPQSNIYIYFKNKEDLLVQLFKKVGGSLGAGQREILDSEQSLEEKIKGVIKNMYDFSMKNPDAMIVIEQIKQLPELTPFFAEAWGSPENPIILMFHQAINEGVVRYIPDEIATGLLFTIINQQAQSVNKGVYTENQFGFEDVYQLIWRSVSVSN